MKRVNCLMIFCYFALSAVAKSPVVAYDIDMAEEICSQLPLENIEGIWLYPDDKVTVMILHDDNDRRNSFSAYTISVV